ncbi:pyridine nucleotide-disulfide oxidoreductase [Candidatus Woesearchaeota archaeon CG11_big_fil_rev_8_21_14_0_20_43_8]|nr:MAG: pyridine nucleotide-disulfide oxidoreductase [Candidatus Woesearchaeota archaeon CG11_big_fil_rev_8_21_14_0_20_43_8]PIO07570.1 MAG: pyridine nucleotide-disulfide oxidoreductase [Candidatus Woesearchaeota archaeon CG08_land_8_20_14_0_20_43_7]
MTNADIVVIGGSAAGISAAITARRHYPEKRILLIRKEQSVQIPCGIPYIFGTVGSPEKNLIPDAVLEKNKIDLLVGTATGIDRDKKRIGIEGSDDVVYDKLILATGSIPIALQIKGLDKENVFTVKKDTEYLSALIEKFKDVKKLVVLGGGFIGVEFADELYKNRDIEITIVEMQEHCLSMAFTEDFCKEAETVLRQNNIRLMCDVKVAEILGDEKVKGIRFEDGTQIDADALLVCIGAKPNIEIAESAGLKTGKGGIIVDRRMRTSDPDIFACGDCTMKKSFFTGKPCPLRLASIATTEARIAGANLYGNRRENPGTIGVFSTKAGDLVIGAVGFNGIETAIEAGFDAVAGEAEAPDRHPGCMPGMSKMKVKLVFNKKNGVIIGGEVRGGPSTGELINAISICILNKMTADQIATFQLGTHPAVTASPIAYQLVNASEMAITKMR